MPLFESPQIWEVSFWYQKYINLKNRCCVQSFIEYKLNFQCQLIKALPSNKEVNDSQSIIVTFLYLFYFTGRRRRRQHHMGTQLIQTLAIYLPIFLLFTLSGITGKCFWNYVWKIFHFISFHSYKWRKNIQLKMIVSFQNQYHFSNTTKKIISKRENHLIREGRKEMLVYIVVCLFYFPFAVDRNF